MRIRILIGMILSAALMALSGCGGGGGGGTTGGVTPGTPTTLKGVASKGPFISGSPVKVFTINQTSGAKGAQVGTGVVLDSQGNYSVEIGTTTGPVIIEVSGTYNDEATAAPKTVDAATPLRAAISNAVAGTNNVMVTALTELAVKKMGGTLVKSNIDAKNGEIATIFKLDNIITTKPANAADATSATATDAEKNYGLALATISQLVVNKGQALDDVLKGISDDITGTVLADKSIVDFKTALNDFVTSTNNKSGVTDASTSPINIGTFKLAHMKISTVLPAGAPKIGGIDFTINLPAGVTMTSDATTKQVTAGVVVSGVAAAAGTTSISLSTLNAQVLRTVLANAQGFVAGEFVDISCTIPTGVTVTKADLITAIKAAALTATDITGATITGATITAADADVTVF